MTFATNLRLSHRRLLFSGLLLFLAAALFSGCSMVAAKTAGGISQNIAAAVLDSDDLATVREGGPAYLIMCDGLVRSAPKNEELLRGAADLYTAYSAMFVEDQARKQGMSEKAMGYALRALAVRRPGIADLRALPMEEFNKALAKAGKAEVPALYTLGAAWAAWIQCRKDDWNAVAGFGKVEALMQKVAELNPEHANGGSLVYLGIMSSLAPEALGGKPEKGRAYFERAVQVSGGKNLMAKVAYAKQVARLVLDRELHDRLLNEVIGADPRAPGLTLANTYAREEARALLKSGDEYF
jgi:hypothetical protein